MEGPIRGGRRPASVHYQVSGDVTRHIRFLKHYDINSSLWVPTCECKAIKNHYTRIMRQIYIDLNIDQGLVLKYNFARTLVETMTTSDKQQCKLCMYYCYVANTNQFTITSLDQY